MVSVERGKAVAVDASGRKEGIWIESRTFTRGNAKVFDVCEERDLKVSIGDKLITYSGQRTKNGAIINGARVTVSGDPQSGSDRSLGKVGMNEDLQFVPAVREHSFFTSTTLVPGQ